MKTYGNNQISCFQLYRFSGSKMWHMPFECRKQTLGKEGNKKVGNNTSFVFLIHLWSQTPSIFTPAMFPHLR